MLLNQDKSCQAPAGELTSPVECDRLDARELVRDGDQLGDGLGLPAETRAQGNGRIKPATC